MIGTQLVKIVKPLNSNNFKSMLHIWNTSNYSSKLFSNFAKNDQVKNNWTLGAQNVSYDRTSKNQVEKSRTGQSVPDLTLKFDPNLKQLSLIQSKRKELVVSDSAPQTGYFCSICNASRCKLFDTSVTEAEEITQLAATNSNLIKISIDRAEFCRTICMRSGGSTKSSSENVSSSIEIRGAEDHSEYCSYCNTTEKSEKPSRSSEARSRGQAEVVKARGSNPRIDNEPNVDLSCEYCNASECGTKGKADGERVALQAKSSNAASSNDETQSPDYCTACRLPQCKYDSPRKSDIKTSAADGVTSDITKSPEYCAECRLPKCKYSKTNQSTAKLASSSGKSETNESADQTTDITKSPEYCSECRLPKCKYLQANQSTAKIVNNSGSNDETSDLGKNQEYCYECRLPKCKYLKATQTTAKIASSSRSNDETSDFRKGADYCPECNSSNKRTIATSRANETTTQTTDITKSQEYCAECRLPKCKYSKTNQSTVRTANQGPNSSDTVIVTVNASEICGQICEDVTNESEGGSGSGGSMENKSPKSMLFHSNYNYEKFFH